MVEMASCSGLIQDVGRLLSTEQCSVLYFTIRTDYFRSNSYIAETKITGRDQPSCIIRAAPCCILRPQSSVVTSPGMNLDPRSQKCRVGFCVAEMKVILARGPPVRIPPRVSACTIIIYDSAMTRLMAWTRANAVCKQKWVRFEYCLFHRDNVIRYRKIHLYKKTKKSGWTNRYISWITRQALDILIMREKSVPNSRLRLRSVYISGRLCSALERRDVSI